MKRTKWWMLLGVPGVGLTAALLGQAVWGQPDTKLPLVPSVPMLAPMGQAPGGGPALEMKTTPLEALPNLQVPPAPVPPPANGPMPGPQVTPNNDLILPLPQTSHSSPGPLLRIEATSPPAAATRDGLSFDVAPGRQQPAVTVEWVGPQSVRIHQPMNCQLIVRNTSTATVQNVTVRHRLGQGVTCKTAEPQAGNEGGELMWNLGTLAPEQTRKINLQLIAGTRGVMQCNAAVTFTSVSGHHVQVREPMLTIKMRAPENVVSGDNVTLMLAISNPGDAATEAIKVKAALPEGLEHVRGQNFEFEVGNLAPKEVRVMKVECLAKGTGMQKCSFVASANDNLTSSDAGQFQILTAKLDVALSGPKLRYLDRHAVYTLKVTNPGSAPASKVEVQELIPPGFKFHQANQGGTFNAQSRMVTWALGDLQAGQSKDVAVDLVPIATGEHRILAQAKTERGLKSEAETRTLVEGLSSLLIDVAHVDDPIEVGAESAFEIRVVNTGTKMESNVQLICTLPSQLAFLGAKCSTTLRYRQEGQQLIFEPLTRLAPKADVIYRVAVKGIAAGDVRFRTRISADGLKEPMQREESMRIYSDDAPLRTTVGSPAPMTTLPQPAPMTALPKPSSIVAPARESLPGSRINEEGARLPTLPAPTPVVPSAPISAPAPSPSLPTPPSLPPSLPSIPSTLPTPPPLELPPRTR